MQKPNQGGYRREMTKLKERKKRKDRYIEGMVLIKEAEKTTKIVRKELDEYFRRGRCLKK